eukprot:scaffold2628_cov113-Isochrysis_galbana.AAC.9
MEQTPADARAAPSASEPNDTVIDIHASPKRLREQAQGNMVSQRATTNAPLWPESQPGCSISTDMSTDISVSVVLGLRWGITLTPG